MYTSKVGKTTKCVSLVECSNDDVQMTETRLQNEVMQRVWPVEFYWAERKVFAFSKRWRKHKLYCHLFTPF
jgi:hypothetical protein